MKKIYFIVLLMGVMSLSSLSATETFQISESECFDRADTAAKAYGNVYDLDYQDEYFYFIDYYDTCMQRTN